MKTLLFVGLLAVLCPWCTDANNGANRAVRGDTTAVLLRLRGGRKGVQAKHTSKEQALKHKLATKNMGGGKEGLQDRLGGKAGHAKVICGCRTMFWFLFVKMP